MYFSDYIEKDEIRNQKRYEVNIEIDVNGVIDGASVVQTGHGSGSGIKGHFDKENNSISYTVTSKESGTYYVTGQFDEEENAIVGKWFNDIFCLTKRDLVVLVERNKKISRDYLREKWKEAMDSDKCEKKRKRGINMVKDVYYHDQRDLCYFINDPRMQLSNEQIASEQEKANANVVLAEAKVDGDTRIFAVTSRKISKGSYLWANFGDDYGKWVNKLSKVRSHNVLVNNILSQNNVEMHYEQF